MSVLQFSCYLHHMESLKTKSRLRRSRAELAMRNGQCIILCNMCLHSKNWMVVLNHLCLITGHYLGRNSTPRVFLLFIM